MKKLTLIILLTLSSNSFAYSIGGMYATLISCSYGQHGYQYGNIGTYRLVNGDIYKVFFGNSHCAY